MSSQDREPGWVLVAALVALVAATCLGILALLWSRG
jgi:hypothetical protein